MSFKFKSSSMMSTPEALKLIEELQKFVVQKNEIIESLEEEVRMLKAERDDLTKEVHLLKAEKLEFKPCDSCSSSESVTPMSDFETPTLLVKPVESLQLSDGGNSTLESITSAGSDSGVCMSNREIASHGETTSYDLVDEKRVADESTNITNIPTINTPKKIIINRTYLPHRSNSARMYELSVDLREKTIECLENKYGGKEVANEAARKIQQSYRHWVISKSFLRMRAFSGRKRSLTMPGKHFEKLKKSSLVFYGPENPVMIIDGESLKIPLEKVRHKSESDITTTEPVASLAELVSDPNLHLDSQSTDSEDSIENEQDTINSGFVDNHFHGKIDAEEKDQVDGSTSNTQADEKKPVKRTASRTSSSSSSQYDIIDDTNVLTVEEKHVDLGDGSSMCVDLIHSHDTTDGLCFSTERRYEAAFDKEGQKRQFRIGVNLFNWKPEVGIQYLIDNEHLEADVPKIAEFLRTHTSISKQKISEYFGNLRNEFNNKVLLEFAKSFDFVGKEVDEALRQFQSYFKLTGEAQTVEKFLQVFSERYVECNPGQISDNPDTILLLAFALAMLNTDLHNQNVKRRMTVEEFLKNLRGTDHGNDLNQDMLRGMYSRIQKNEFATGADHMTQLYQIENSFVGKVPNLAATHRQFVKLFTVGEVYDPTKKEKPHNRLAFLFNDLLLLAKPRGKSGAHGSSGHTFSCKASFSLLNKRVAEFKNDNYPFGVLLIGKLDNKAIVKLNLKDEKTKKGFVEELDEYIRETNGLENIRIALTKAKQLSWHNRRNDDGRTKSLLISDDTQIGAMDKAETTSLMDLRVDSSEVGDISRNRLTSDGKIINSVSMGDINESDIDQMNNDESEYGKIVRTNSTSSLDSKLSANSKDETHLYHQQANSLPVRSSTVKKTHHHMFGTWGPKVKKSPSTASNRATSPSFLRKGDKSPSQLVTRQKSSTFMEGTKSATMSKREKRKSLTGSIS